VRSLEGQIARVEHKTLEERVYDELVRLIAAGVLAPGAPLEEHDLAERLGVSRTPLRAAIARLVQEGLVVTAPYRGASVRRFTAKEIDGLYEVRLALEQLAVRRAAERIDAELLAALEAVVAACERAREHGDPAALAAADAEFHRLIATAADNATLAGMLGSLDLRIRGLRHVALADSEVSRGDPPRRPHNRALVLAALRRHDGEAAARLIVEHIDAVRRTVVAHLAANSAEP
jgi:DNA-binding GntR family transcriptional regulator